MPFLQKYKKLLSISATVIVVVVLYVLSKQPSSSSLSSIEPITPLAAIESTQLEIEQPPQMFIVDVKGAVRYPGVYSLTEGMRIKDAIEAAGGYTDEANPTLINHAQKLQDEMVLYIPAVGEQLSQELETVIMNASSQASSSTTNSSGKINLNKATEAELTQLPGIGPSKANAIIQHRAEQGPFKTVDDLKQVTGIGEKTFEQLKDLIDVK